jgi:hypothetical protein
MTSSNSFRPRTINRVLAALALVALTVPLGAQQASSSGSSAGGAHVAYSSFGSCNFGARHWFDTFAVRGTTEPLGYPYCADPNRWWVTETTEANTSVSDGATGGSQGGWAAVTDSLPMALISYHSWCTAFCGAGTVSYTLT